MRLKAVLISAVLMFLLASALTGFLLFTPLKISPNVGLTFMALFCRPANSSISFARCSDDTVVFFQTPVEQMLAETEKGTTSAIVEIYSLKNQNSCLANVEIKKTIDSLSFGPHPVSREEFERLHLGKRWQRALALARLPDHRDKIITNLGQGKFLLLGGRSPEGDFKDNAIVFDTDHLRFFKPFTLELNENPDRTFLLPSGEVMLIGGQRDGDQIIQIVDLSTQSSRSVKLKQFPLADSPAVCPFKDGWFLSIGGRSKLDAVEPWWTNVTAVDPASGLTKNVAKMSHGRAFGDGNGWKPLTVGLVTPNLLIVCGGRKKSGNLLSVSGYENDYSVEILPVK